MPRETDLQRRPLVQSLEARHLLANAVVIDLLAVFTPGAVTAVGSEAILRSRLQDSVDAANRAMSNSKIAVSIRLVHADPIAYTGSNDLYTDRTRLEAGTNGLAAAQTLRNTYAADLVTLIVEAPPGSGGNASLMTSLTDPANASTHAFSAIASDSLQPYNYTIAHELGHNLGAGHERGNPDGTVGIFSYSYGYRFTAAGQTRHDIMSYDPGTEVPFYANPAVSFRGSPTGAPIGSANEADLASTFAQTAPVVANYRATVVADTTAPLARVDNIRIRAGFAYVTVRYADESGIDLTTIDSNDITLTIPGLPSAIPAALDSIENAGVGGAFNRVTYRAYLRDVPTVPSDIVVRTNSSAVKDLAGNTSPGTTLAFATAFTTGYSYDTARDLGTLALNDALQLGESLADQSTDDVYQFTLTSAATLSAKLTNMSADGNLFLARDTNGDGVYQFNEAIVFSTRTSSQSESLAANLTPGTYFAWVYGNVTTSYRLQLSTYVDTTRPTAALDAPDLNSGGNFNFAVRFTDDVEMDANTTRYYAPVRITNPFGGYYVAFPNFIDPDLNSGTCLAGYSIAVGHTLTAADNGTYTVSLEAPDSPIFTPALTDFVHDGAGNRVLPGTLGTFKVGVGVADTTLPNYVSTAATTVYRGGATSYDFDVTFTDNIGVNLTALSTSQVTVTGPDGVPRVANFSTISAPVQNVGRYLTARYHLTNLPRGAWDYTDVGTYALTLVASKVKDSAGNTLGAIPLGSFNVAIPMPGDANGDGRVNFDDLIVLAQNYNTTLKTFAQGNFDDDAAGNVNFDDLIILAQRYNTQRAALVAPQIVASTPTKKHIADDILY